MCIFGISTECGTLVNNTSTRSIPSLIFDRNNMTWEPVAVSRRQLDTHKTSCISTSLTRSTNEDNLLTNTISTTRVTALFAASFDPCCLGLYRYDPTITESINPRHGKSLILSRIFSDTEWVTIKANEDNSETTPGYNTSVTFSRRFNQSWTAEKDSFSKEGTRSTQ